MERRLYRSRTNSMISGVAGGVGEWLAVDPTLVRVAWVVLAFITGGLALIVYLVMIFVVPEGPDVPADVPPAGPSGATTEEEAAAPPATSSAPPPSFSGRRGSGVNGTLILGLGLILLGAYFLLRQYIPAIAWGQIWPIALIVLGAVILISAARARSSD